MNSFRSLTVLACLLPVFAGAQEDIYANPENLKVLPENISTNELRNTMKGFALGLGVRCETCHVGEAGQGLSEFDFASDEKTMKRKARVMLKMVQAINGEHVPRLNVIEESERVEVRCVTCHRGRPQPKLIQDVLDEEIENGGIRAAVEKYEELRETFYGSHSYDFSEFVLPVYAQDLLGRGKPEAALIMAELNAGYFADSYFTYFVIGEIHNAQGNSDKALLNYRRAVEINPQATTWLQPKIAQLEKE